MSALELARMVGGGVLVALVLLGGALLGRAVNDALDTWQRHARQLARSRSTRKGD